MTVCCLVHGRAERLMVHFICSKKHLCIRQGFVDGLACFVFCSACQGWGFHMKLLVPCVLYVSFLLEEAWPNSIVNTRCICTAGSSRKVIRPHRIEATLVIPHYTNDCTVDVASDQDANTPSHSRKHPNEYKLVDGENLFSRIQSVQSVPMMQIADILS